MNLTPPFGLEIGLPVEIVAFLVLVAFCAGFVDAIAGGGGLLAVPALMLAGVPPVTAIATNKLQSTFGVASSTFAFWRAGRIEKHLVVPLGLSALAGGATGAFIAHLAPAGVLRLVIPFLLVGVALYLAFSPKLGDDDAHPRVSIPVFALTFGAAIGFYDGVFGPGAGTFYLIALILMAGFGVMRAMAHTKLMNFASNFAALIAFALTGHILVALGLVMGVTSALGGYLGARIAMRFGAGLVKPMVIVVALLMALRLLLDPAHPFGGWLRALIRI